MWTRSSWLNCALRDDEAVYWVCIGHSEAVAVGNWWYGGSRRHLCLYILHKVEIWRGVTDALLTDSLTTLKDSDAQLLTQYKSGALVTQFAPPAITAETRRDALWFLSVPVIDRHYLQKIMNIDCTVQASWSILSCIDIWGNNTDILFDR